MAYVETGYWLSGYAVGDAAPVPELPSGDIQLSDYTVAELSALLESIGVTVEYLNSAFASMSSLILMDGSGDQDATNGDHLYGYTSLLWSYLAAVVVELRRSQVEVKNALLQMSVATAEGWWLDLLGSYYKVQRIGGETDDQYAFRIIAETLMPKGNNYAISIAVERVTGQQCDVLDVARSNSEPPHYYNGNYHYNGEINHLSIEATRGNAGLFDIQLSYDLLGNVDLTAYRQQIVSKVNRLRDSGTFLRSISLLGASVISDEDLAGPGDALSMALTKNTYYDGLIRHYGLVTYGGLTLSPETL